MRIIVEVTKPGTFEYLFTDFVEAFGGIVLPEAATGKTADYLFSRYNVIAELKTLLVDSTAEMNNKVMKLLQDWSGDPRSVPFEQGPNGNQLAISKAPPEIAEKWLAKIIQQVERLVHDANKQIADTKARERLMTARGVLLIANPKNTYHSDPESYKQILVNVLQKKDSAGLQKYPHINACVYFAAGDIISERGYFWANIIMQQTPAEDISDLETFQDDLKLGLNSYIRNTLALIAERDAGRQS
jgi:hypothetical protein